MSKNKSLIIGTDIDDVLCEYVATLTQFYNKVYDENLSLDNIKVWDLKQAYSQAGTPEATRALMEHFIQSPLFSQMPPVPGSLDAIKEMAGRGHQIVFISARGSKAIDGCYKWFDKHGLPLKNIYFNREKDWLVDKLGVDVFVDDGVHNLEKIAALRKPVQTIIYTRPWNKQAVTNYAHHRVSDWKGVLDIVRDLE